MKPRWPRLAEALAASSAKVADLGLAADALVRVTQRAVPVEEHDLVVYALHAWLRAQWGSQGVRTDSSFMREANRALGGFGVRLELMHEGGRCVSDSLLVGSLLERAGTNPWADRVFLEFMRDGWEQPCGFCGYGAWFGPDEWRPVIERGELLLHTHATSPIWRDVALLVAEAHETAWSLSKGHEYAEEVELIVDPRAYQRDAPEHRRRAIELYERLVREDPRVAADAFTRRRLRRLQLDIDTNFHLFSCLSD